MITAQKKASAQENRFCIASFNGAADVIEVSVRNLIDVYTGVPVRVGGMPNLTNPRTFLIVQCWLVIFASMLCFENPSRDCWRSSKFVNWTAGIG